MLFRVEPVCGGDALPKLLQSHFKSLSIKPPSSVPNANAIKVNSPKRIREAAMSGIFPVLKPSSSSRDSRGIIFQALRKNTGTFHIRTVTNNNQKAFLSSPYKRTRIFRVRLSGAACED